MRNTAGVGVTAALTGIDPEQIRDLMRESMDGDMLEANLEVFDEALDLVDDADIGNEISLPESSHDEEQAFISGSEAVAYGALDSGCRFISGYPMTPWTDVFTIMSQHLPEVGGISEQVEDEIAAAALAVGASHAGVKAMSGSSGGGFALMSEPLGLAEMTETPVVLIEAMRAGPSTGMPTKTEQGDLEHILYTSQGDSSRVVFAPNDPTEAYEQTREAFRVAYEYQIPAIIIIDQKLSGENSNIPVSFFDREPDPSLGATLSEEELAEAAHDASGKFKRFGYDPEDGVSPRSLPGQKGGRFLATGNEHNEVGHISEDPTNRVLQMDKRVEKLDRIAADLDDGETHQTVHGDESADYGILSFGSTGGAVADAVDRLADDGHSVKAMNVSRLMPFAEAEVDAFLRSVDAAIVVEMNATAQFRGLIQRELGRHGSKLHSLLKYNGNPFEPGEVVRGFEAEIDGGTATPAATTRVEPAAGD
jgi:pyruvate ferredoxin oxidoreductase alpha subunit